MKKIALHIAPFVMVLLMALSVCADTIVFGNETSEGSHGLVESFTERYVGEGSVAARRFLPMGDPEWVGGTMEFDMEVDSERQNYFTVSSFGGEADETLEMLFIGGKQIGYRHLGDIDLIHRGNGHSPCPGKIVYTTLPLPLSATKGKSRVRLGMRSYGSTWDYGSTFEPYQRAMKGKVLKPMSTVVLFKK